MTFKIVYGIIYELEEQCEGIKKVLPQDLSLGVWIEIKIDSKTLNYYIIIN